MNESKQELKTLAIVWAIFFSLNSLCTATIAALAGTKWVEVSAQTKFLIVLAIVGNYTNTMGSFISKAVSRIKDGKTIVNGSGDTAPPFKPESKTP